MARDIHELRAGEAWNDRLKELIQRADVFQLFWSRNAMRSPYVQEEWRYALSLGRPHFVRPTYWEDPLPEDPRRGLPPDELRRLHFQLLSTGTAATGAHGPFFASGFDPNGTVFAGGFEPAEEEEPALDLDAEPADFESFNEPSPPELEEDDTVVGAAPLLDLDDTAVAPLPPPPAWTAPASAPARQAAAVPKGPPPLPASGRRGGWKIAAVLATAILGLTLFTLRVRNTRNDTEIASFPNDTPATPTTPGNQTLGSPGPSNPSNQGNSSPPADHDVYDAAAWRELTAACELSREDAARLPSREVPGASMIEVFASPTAFNARVVKQHLESKGAFVLPRREDGRAVCAVVLDPHESVVQDYLKELRARGTEPRVVLFPAVPGHL